MGRILNAPTLLDHGHIDGRKLLLEILEAGLHAADPYHATLAALRIEGETLTVGGDAYAPPGTPLPGPEVVDLRQVGRIFVLGAGKGIQGCARAVEELLGERLTGGHVIDKQGTPHILQRIEVTFGAHPVPDEACVRGCERILEMARNLRPDDLVITMIGNGIGSLLTLPVEGVSLEDVRRVVYAFQIEQGGPTIDLVPIRNHLDRIKGGRFSRYLQPARAVHLIALNRDTYQAMMTSPLYRWLHTLPDETTAADAVASLKKWDVWASAPAPVRQYLSQAAGGNETLTIAEFEQMRSRIFYLFPTELGMAPTARAKAAELGFEAHVLFNNNSMMAEAGQVGKVVANMAKHSELDGDPFVPPVALISSGELLVTVGETRGMGGRNQEYALSAALELAGTEGVIMGSIDSDGTDGPGHQFVEGDDYRAIPVLAGAIVDGSTAPRAQALGIELHAALKRHDTSPALYRLGDGIVATPGLSMTDLSVTLILGSEKQRKAAMKEMHP
jgi:glycerate-2-kinase